MTANPKLIKERKIRPENAEQINQIHQEIDQLVADMAGAQQFSGYLAKYTELNYKLQDLWGFKRDKTKHRSYRLPHCTCPKMDNDDAGGYYYVNADCPVHENEN